MSLLLEALKPTEPSTPVDPAPQEDPLDALETLELLTTKRAAPAPLTLAPSLDLESDSPTATEPRPESQAALQPEPVPVAEFAPAAPISGRALETAGPAPSTGPRPSARTQSPAPPVAHPAKKYRLLIVMAALAGAALGARILWPPKPQPFRYPQPRESQQQQLTTATPPPATPPMEAVKVSSERPPDQFAYAGNAPEIDLPAESALAGTAHRPRSSAADVTRAATAEVPAADDAAPAEPPPAARRRTRPFSVTRSEGLTPIDRHIQMGYGALASGDIATARHEYFAALDLDPNNVDGLMGVATVAARDGKPAVAAATYAKVLKLEPGNPDAVAAIAMLHASGAATELDESRLKVLIATDDGSRPALHAALGGVYAADARWAEAAQEYFAALSKDPGNPDLAFDLAASLDQSRSVAMALKYYQQALGFAAQRPTQLDVPAIERRVAQLQARNKP